MNDLLFTPYRIGNLLLPNRIIMAPLTRSRATVDGVTTPMMATYYKQRSGAGLLISEATNISQQGTGYPYTPGIYTTNMINSWKQVTRAVKDIDGRIFMQLWHVGRHSHPWYQENGTTPVSASPIIGPGSIKTPEGIKETVTPRELNVKEIAHIVKNYGQAAENAMDAGFDGVEIHGANGYLIDQFIQDGTNRRNDEYGGDIINRSRFLFEVVSEVIRRIGSERTALRLSPAGMKLNMSDSDPEATFSYIVSKLNDYDLAYLHLLEPLEDVSHLSHYPQQVSPLFRKLYTGTLVANGGFTAESANKTISDSIADLVAFGKPFISNPNLVEKFRKNTPLTPWDTRTFYTQGSEGYTDYN